MAPSSDCIADAAWRGPGDGALGGRGVTGGCGICGGGACGFVEGPVCDEVVGKQRLCNDRGLRGGAIGRWSFAGRQSGK